MSESYNIDIRFKTRVQRSERIMEIAEAFGIGLEEKEFVIYDNLGLTIPQGGVVYITGQSGGGKSLLLRELEKQMKERGKKTWNIDQCELQDVSLVCQIGKNVEDALRIMSLAGLNDAFLYARTPSELSDGQRYRFKLAKAIEQGSDAVFADEFLAVLDRTTAKILAFSIAKICRENNITLLVATTHTDMIEDLAPDVFIEKRFRERVRIEAAQRVLKEIENQPFTRADFNRIMGEVL